MNTIINPNTGQKSKPLKTTSKEIDTILKQLNTAQLYWNAQNMQTRIKTCIKIQQTLIKHKRALSISISKETGKPFWESSTEINAAIAKIDASIASIKYRCKFPSIKTPKRNIQTIIKPYGVIGVLGPFNFPVHIPHGQIIPSLLTGNAVAFKPSEYVPKTSQLYIKLIKQCFNNMPCPIDIIYGSKLAGETIVNHKITKFIFFTGSYNTGRDIEKVCINIRKPVALELGGNNPCIIESYKNEPELINHIITSAFITTGQRCSSTRRLIINKKHTHLIEAICKKTTQLSIHTYPSKKQPFMGPVVLPSVKQQIVSETFSQSKTLLSSYQIGEGGLISPRIEHCKPSFQFDDELFGPILFITLSDSFEESIQLANNTNYGLTSSIYTTKKQQYLYAQKNINAGIINWNNPTTGASGLAPFGGVKNSGNNRPGGFCMIDHCFIPIGTTQSKQIEPIKYPGL